MSSTGANQSNEHHIFKIGDQPNGPVQPVSPIQPIQPMASELIQVVEQPSQLEQVDLSDTAERIEASSTKLKDRLKNLKKIIGNQLVENNGVLLMRYDPIIVAIREEGIVFSVMPVTVIDNQVIPFIVCLVATSQSTFNDMSQKEQHLAFCEYAILREWGDSQYMIRFLFPNTTVGDTLRWQKVIKRILNDNAEPVAMSNTYDQKGRELLNRLILLKR